MRAADLLTVLSNPPTKKTLRKYRINSQQSILSLDRCRNN